MGIASKQISKLFSVDGIERVNITAPPSSMTGSTGDIDGMIAFDETGVYYNTQTFVSGSSYVWTTMVGAGNPNGWNNQDYGGNSVWIPYYSPYDTTPVPQVGWVITDGVNSRTITIVFPNPGSPGMTYVLYLDSPVDFSTATSIEYIEVPTITANWKKADYDEYYIYEALLTQTGVIIGTDISYFGYKLVIGETYTITGYANDDDFSNVAKVISGNINETDCVFIATGNTPTKWTNGSELQSNGDIVVQVLNNTLGYDIDWSWAPFGSYGYYVGINDATGPASNSFPREKIFATAQNKYGFDWSFSPPQITISPANFMGVDDFINISVYDWYADDYVDNALYYTPIQIKIKK